MRAILVSAPDVLRDQLRGATMERLIERCALWRIVIVRMRVDPNTRAYVARRTAEGLGKKEIIRCLKRHVAREIYRELIAATDPDCIPTRSPA
jgi:hypothetical protein